MALQHPVILSLVTPFISGVDLSYLICACPIIRNVILSSRDITSYVVNLTSKCDSERTALVVKTRGLPRMAPAFLQLRYLRQMVIWFDSTFERRIDYDPAKGSTNRRKLFLPSHTLASASPCLQSLRIRIPMVILSFIELSTTDGSLTKEEWEAWRLVVKSPPLETDLVRWLPLGTLFKELQHLEIMETYISDAWIANRAHCVAFTKVLPDSLFSLNVDFLATIDIIDHLPSGLEAWTARDSASAMPMGHMISRPPSRGSGSLDATESLPSSKILLVAQQLQSLPRDPVNPHFARLDWFSLEATRRLSRLTQLRQLSFKSYEVGPHTFEINISANLLEILPLPLLTHLEIEMIYLSQLNSLPRGLISLKTGIAFPPGCAMTPLTIGVSAYTRSDTTKTARTLLSEVVSDAFSSFPPMLQVLIVTSLVRKMPRAKDAERMPVRDIGEPLQLTPIRSGGVRSAPAPASSAAFGGSSDNEDEDWEMPFLPRLGRRTATPSDTLPKNAHVQSSIVTMEALSRLPTSLTQLCVHYSTEVWVEETNHASSMFEKLSRLRSLSLTVSAPSDTILESLPLHLLGSQLEVLSLRIISSSPSKSVPNLLQLLQGPPRPFLRSIVFPRLTSNNFDLIDGGALVSSLLKHLKSLRNLEVGFAYFTDSWLQNEAPLLFDIQPKFDNKLVIDDVLRAHRLSVNFAGRKRSEETPRTADLIYTGLNWLSEC